MWQKRAPRYITCCFFCDVILEFDPGRFEKWSLKKRIKSKTRPAGCMVHRTYCHQMDGFSCKTMGPSKLQFFKWNIWESPESRLKRTKKFPMPLIAIQVLNNDSPCQKKIDARHTPNNQQFLSCMRAFWFWNKLFSEISSNFIPREFTKERKLKRNHSRNNKWF